ncbi:hypothetical protein AYI70_g2586 [Smittium culicis]|uniref:Uncharacterized protein n=1 Tax=Smittium culicis TaxID=133412 RepID=A0A1R1Y7T1_9FUNG|nr:hypothetical protein AYI70_g2586 [Smittium culicis]
MKLYKHSLKRENSKLKNIFEKNKFSSIPLINKNSTPTQADSSSPHLTNASSFDSSQKPYDLLPESKLSSDKSNEITLSNNDISLSKKSKKTPVKGMSNSPQPTEQNFDSEHDAFLINYFKQRELEKLFNG